MLHAISSRMSLALAFIVSFLIAFALLSRAAHGAPADLDAPDASPPVAMGTSNATTPPLVASPSLTVPPDPIDDPSGAIDALRAAWRDGRLLGTTLVVLYLLILFAKRYVSWLATGRRAVVVAALTTALVTAISTLTSGTATLAWALEAVSVGVLLYLRSEAQAKISDDPDEGGQGKIRPLSA
jgi:hypothetical protein